METKKVKATISSIEEKKWKDKNFIVLLTSEGEVSCWKPELFSILQAVKSNKELVEIELTKTAKGNWAISGIEGVNSPAPRSREGQIKTAIENKNKKIGELVDRKENSMRSFAIKRDASLFASVCHSGFDGPKQTDELINAHKFWLNYFEKIY